MKDKSKKQTFHHYRHLGLLKVGGEEKPKTNNIIKFIILIEVYSYFSLNKFFLCSAKEGRTVILISSVPFSKLSR